MRSVARIVTLSAVATAALAPSATGLGGPPATGRYSLDFVRIGAFTGRHATRYAIRADRGLVLRANRRSHKVEVVGENSCFQLGDEARPHRWRDELCYWTPLKAADFVMSYERSCRRRELLLVSAAGPGIDRVVVPVGTTHVSLHQFRPPRRLHQHVTYFAGSVPVTAHDVYAIARNGRIVRVRVPAASKTGRCASLSGTAVA